MLIASCLAGVVVLAGAVVAAVGTSASAQPSFASDEPLVTSLLLTARDVPGAITAGHQVYRPAQVAANPALYPPASVLHGERACALLEGPTSPRDLTALAVDGYSAQYEIVAEAAAYASTAPVEADEAGLAEPDLLSCVKRLMEQLLQVNGLHGEADDIQRVSLGEALGDIRFAAVLADWQVNSTDPNNQASTDTVEFVVLLHGRAEVVVLAQSDEGPIPQGLIDRVSKRLAAQLDARFPS